MWSKSPGGQASLRANDVRRTAQGKKGLQNFIGRSGLTREAASIIWHQIRDAEACCTICGIPEHRLTAYARRNAPCPSFHITHRHLEVDRIIPGSMGGEYVPGNVRPLCPKCNWLRGPARRPDHEVRTIMWKKWQEFEDMKHLRWFKNLHVVNGKYTLRGPDDQSSAGV